MPFVKLDCGILNSTIWFQPVQRDVFITALLMAEPYELREPMSQIEVRSLEETGFVVPPGWYGFVPAAGVGIVGRAKVDEEAGLNALEALGSPDSESRSPEFEGRRMVRINGGYLVLNYQKYRERDYTAKDRSRRYRERQASRREFTPSRRDITQAEVEAEAEVYKTKREGFAPPSVSAVAAYCKERGNRVDPESFISFYQSKNWLIGKNKMKDWKAAVITWEKRSKSDETNRNTGKPSLAERATAARKRFESR